MGQKAKVQYFSQRLFLHCLAVNLLNLWHSSNYRFNNNSTQESLECIHTCLLEILSSSYFTDHIGLKIDPPWLAHSGYAHMLKRGRCLAPMAGGKWHHFIDSAWSLELESPPHSLLVFPHIPRYIFRLWHISFLENKPLFWFTEHIAHLQIPLKDAGLEHCSCDSLSRCNNLIYLEHFLSDRKEGVRSGLFFDTACSNQKIHHQDW